MPVRYVLDAHAWVEYLRGSSPGRRVKELVDSGDIYTSSLTLAEVVVHVAGAGQDADLAARAIGTLSDVVDVDDDLALRAAKRYARMKKSGKKAKISQAYLLETAKKLGAEIISGDKSLSTGRATLIK